MSPRALKTALALSVAVNLFAVAGVLRTEGGLRRAVTDPSVDSSVFDDSGGEGRRRAGERHRRHLGAHAELGL